MSAKGQKFVPVGDFRLMEDEKAAIMEVLDKGRISEWQKVAEFERVFAKYVGSKHCITTSSGTSALILSLLALRYDGRWPRFKHGGKVITSPVSYIATSNALCLSNLEPVYVDIDPRTFKLDISSLERLLEEEGGDTFAGMLPVHLMGYPNDMDRITKLANEYGLAIVEDSAQAHGSRYNGRRTGSIGIMGTFSFFIAHNIQAGEMGCVTTSDEKLLKLMRQLKANGRVCDCPVCTRSAGICPHLGLADEGEDLDPRFTHEYISYNFKTMEFQAALGVCQMKKADWIFQRRLDNVKYLNDKLKKFSHVLDLPLFSEDVGYLAYPLVLKEGCGISRLNAREGLRQKGVENRPLYGCIPTQQPAYAAFKERYEGRLPNAERVGRDGFYIGCHQYLERDDLDHVVEAFEEVFGGL
ncbi:MAG: DegT/DnrJ/EryC1/StrS family aminotransferase [Candidatus Thermoplasmatota archaeon]|nr:DegT/DnrJ/EryC1/StrS family aminotransferase [Candidatus Thermoplasmatota archaeon]